MYTIFFLIFIKRIFFVILNFFGFFLIYQIKYCSDKSVDTTKYGIKLSDIYNGKELLLIIYGREKDFTIHLSDSIEKVPNLIFNITRNTPTFNNLYEKKGIEL